MTPVQYEAASKLFAMAVELDEPGRKSLLDQQCPDVEVRSAVESMLREDAAHDDTFDASSGIGQKLLQMSAGMPERIGQYRITQLLGEGGMGIVYEAEQSHPRRHVAIKIMRIGLNMPGHRRELTERFRRETQVLGQLEHPGIARVYEAGVEWIADQPVPWIAMELVRGLPVTQYAQRKDLDLRGRLELLARICDAVQYAHQKGIVHRDLKPANLIVSERTGTPRVLDFGIARILDAGDERDEKIETITQGAQIVGTLPYMSPEQVGGCAADVDTRSDVYSLGVILYELLSGRRPLDLTGVSITQAARLIQEQHPPRLHSLPLWDGSSSRALRGDLETIVGKAMQKDAAQRYASASQFSEDIRRYLRNEPIRARPATAIYHLRKFAQRNPWLVGSALVAVMALIGGIIGTLHQAGAAIRARDQARHETEIANSVAKHFHDVMSLATPQTGSAQGLTLSEAIDRMWTLMNKGFDGPPEAEAIVRNSVGIVFRNRGEFDRAEKEFARALELRKKLPAPDDTDVAEVIHNLALTKRMSGHAAESLPLYTEALALQRKSLSPDDPRIPQTLYNLARATVEAGEYAEGKKLVEESLALHQKLRIDKPELIAKHDIMLARLARMQGDLNKATQQAQHAVTLMRDDVAPGHPSLAAALIEMAQVLLAKGDVAAAEPLAREADEINHKAYAKQLNHPASAESRAVRIEILRRLGRTKELETLETPSKAQSGRHGPNVTNAEENRPQGSAAQPRGSTSVGL